MFSRLLYTRYLPLYYPCFGLTICGVSAYTRAIDDEYHALSECSIITITNMSNLQLQARLF